MEKSNQRMRIIEYIKKYGSITSRDAQFKLGISDPRKRISELRANGYLIVDKWEKGKNRYGEGTIYKRYSFADDEDV